LNDLCTAIDTRSDGHLFHISILSLATLFFGTQHRNTSILQRGYLIHETALRQLNDSLSSPQCHLRDDVLLSVIALVLLEIFMPTGREHYLKHMSGLEKLLELRGPNSHHSPRSRETLKGVRRMIILASMRKRKPSILAREEWKSIPWMTENVAERAEHYLWNVLADYTVLVADHDRAIQNGFNFEDIAYHHQRKMIACRAQDLLGQLHEWKKAWNPDVLHSHSEISPEFAEVQSVPTCAGSTLNFQTVFDFQIPSAATILVLYNTALIYVLQILSSVLPADPQVQGLEDSSYLHPTTQNKYAAMKRSAALEISRCIPYYLAHKSQFDTGSVTIAHLAVRTAFQTLGGSSSLDGEWMMGLLNMKRGEVFAKGLWVD
jgi:hypothetical protein